MEDGKVKSAFVEPDNTSVNGKYSHLPFSLDLKQGIVFAMNWLGCILVSAADKVLG